MNAPADWTKSREQALALPATFRAHGRDGLSWKVRSLAEARRDPHVFAVAEYRGGRVFRIVTFR